jgi:hypothetical protein
MIINILIGLAAVVVVFVIVVASRPDDFRVTRTATIAAPAEAVFEQVNDLHKWQAWSPWAKLDPAVRNACEGPPAGPGAILRWAGNKKVGEGSMTITESCPNDLLRLKLEFLKPFKATNIAEFTFKPDGRRTVIVWSMFGKSSFFFKAVGLFVNCDKMVGSDFERGLANLTSVVESANKQQQLSMMRGIR